MQDKLKGLEEKAATGVVEPKTTRAGHPKPKIDVNLNFTPSSSANPTDQITAPQQRHSQKLPRLDPTLFTKQGSALVRQNSIQSNNSIQEAYKAINALSQDVLNLQAQV